MERALNDRLRNRSTAQRLILATTLVIAGLGDSGGYWIGRYARARRRSC